MTRLSCIEHLLHIRIAVRCIISKRVVLAVFRCRTPWQELCGTEWPQLETHISFQFSAVLASKSVLVQNRTLKAFTQCMRNATTHPACSYHHLVAQVWVEGAFQSICSITSPALQIAADAAAAAAAGAAAGAAVDADDDMSSAERWHAYLDHLGIRPLISAEAIGTLVASGVSKVGLGYCRTQSISFCMLYFAHTLHEYM